MVLSSPALAQELDTDAPSPNCEQGMKNLNDQDNFIKGVMVDRTMRPSQKRIHAAAASGFFQANMSIIGVVCPPGLSNQVRQEVNQRVGQLNTFIETGQWAGPPP